MRLRVVAVGTRMPRWVDEAFAEYAGRMPRTARVELIEIRAEPRTQGKPRARLLEAEARRAVAAIPEGYRVVALDEHGRTLTTAELAQWLARAIDSGSDTAFLIGGADGLAPSLMERAQMRLALSAMTLPHGLARVLLAEQLYRAASILQNHPYHRE